MKPRIYNTNYYEVTFEPDSRHRYATKVKPWVVNYGGHLYAMAATQPQAVDELVRLQWAGEIPGPGQYE